MKKPKFHVTFRLLKWSQCSLIPRYYFLSKLLWKDKFNSPRVEHIPGLLISWLWFQLDIYKGNDAAWEWWLWVTKYNNGDIQKSIESWPWSYMDEGTGKFIKSNPHLKYNKK